MKKILKGLGKIPVLLEKRDESDMRHSVLLVDGSFIHENSLVLMIRNAREKFRNLDLEVLTFDSRGSFLRENFPDIEIIVPGPEFQSYRWSLARKLRLLLRNNYDSVILSSLDIATLATCICFSNCRLFLHNRWFQWYRIRQRTLWDLVKGSRSADHNNRRPGESLKKLIKSFGRAFIILDDFEEDKVISSLLIIDNGYTDSGHVLMAVRKAESLFVNPSVTILTFASRKHHFEATFPQVRIETIASDRGKYALAWRMIDLRKEKFSDIILTTLDITPVAVSLLSLGSRFFLYNQWHEWWSLRFKGVRDYANTVFRLLRLVPFSVYLAFSSGSILLLSCLRRIILSGYIEGQKNEA